MSILTYNVDVYINTHVFCKLARLDICTYIRYVCKYVQIILHLIYTGRKCCRYKTIRICMVK